MACRYCSEKIEHPVSKTLAKVSPAISKCCILHHSIYLRQAAECRVCGVSNNQVTVCESHSIPGGAAHAWVQNGYHFESGPSLYSGMAGRCACSCNQRSTFEEGPPFLSVKHHIHMPVSMLRSCLKTDG